MRYLLSTQAPVNRLNALKLLRKVSALTLFDAKRVLDCMESAVVEVPIWYITPETTRLMNEAGLTVASAWQRNEHITNVYERQLEYSNVMSKIDIAISNRDGDLAIQMLVTLKRWLNNGSLISPPSA